MLPIIQARDIDPAVLQPPFTLALVRAVQGPYLRNGARYLGVHCAPSDPHRFLLTAIADETTPELSDNRGKLMVQGGAQYGCPMACPFCVYAALPFHRNLSSSEMVDLFRLVLFLRMRVASATDDRRQLILKFTDNGEPLLNPELIAALDRLLVLFGKGGKILRLKVSTILADREPTRDIFRDLISWQRENAGRASVHLQISHAPYLRQKSIPAPEIAEMVQMWGTANPDDLVCIAPGLVRGHDAERFHGFLDALSSVRERCFLRLSVIKPSKPSQKRGALDAEEHASIAHNLRARGFSVRPLQTGEEYVAQLRGAGTLSCAWGGRTFDPATYIPWEYDPTVSDPNAST